MPDRHKVHGFLYEPGVDNGSDKNGYIHFYDVIEASSQDEAFAMAYEDYGEYNTLEHHGIAKTDAEVEDWLSKNPD